MSLDLAQRPHCFHAMTNSLLRSLLDTATCFVSQWCRNQQRQYFTLYPSVAPWLPKVYLLTEPRAV